jgi:hypothetical protein
VTNSSRKKSAALFMPAYVVRATVSLVRIEIRAALDFYEHTDANFQRAIRSFDADIAKYPASFWDQEPIEGFSPGDLASDQRVELLSLSELTGTFGIIMVYSIFERFLQNMFEYIKLGNVLSEEMRRARWLDFKGHKDALKTIGIDITRAPFDYQELLKLNAIRNALTHQGGWVTEENAKKLKPFGFARGNSITISQEYFKSAALLILTTSEDIAEAYLKFASTAPKIIR